MISLLIAGLVSIVISLLMTPLFISWLRDRSIGQQIRQDGPHGHHVKAGTPTIGGACIVVAALIAYAVAHSRIGAVYTRSGLLVMFAILGTAFIGFLDDWIKVRNGRSLGLTTWQKLLGQSIVAIIFAVLAVEWAAADTNLSWTRWDSLNFDLGTVGWIVFAVLLIVGFSNAVNLTDGLDGLAAGTSAFAFSTFAVIGFWQLRNYEIYRVPGTISPSLDLALVAVAMAGACVGFLWWNAAPARIFMGDTGSLAIGAGMAALALMLNVELLLFVIGGLFIVETASVIIQVLSFRFFKKRVFRMAPIHHHFELNGWPETHVIIRFWIVAGLFTAIALGLFYADFLSLGRVDV
jgi:phospho-N-acetylmuramoyl-pentapeptide-transferase